MLGLAALFVETTLLTFSAYAALSARALQTAVRPGRSSAEPHRIVPGNVTVIDVVGLDGQEDVG
jgi:hypothetical protein